MGDGRRDTSTVSRTGIGSRAATPDSAASRPRSSSTAGCRPRNSWRSSSRAALASSWASAMIWFACAASGCAARAMPSRIASETSRCWVPSCRSRSSRRRSASAASTTPARVSARRSTRCSSSWARLGPSSIRAALASQRPDRGGEPRRGRQQRNPPDGQEDDYREVRDGREVSGQRRRLVAPEQAPRRQRPGVDVHKRVQDQPQEYREDGQGGHGQGEAGQQVVTELAPGGLRAGRGHDPPHAQPLGMTGCAGISTPAVARRRWRWIPVSSGTARNTITRRREEEKQLPPGPRPLRVPGCRGPGPPGDQHDEQGEKLRRDAPGQVQRLAPGLRRPRNAVVLPNRLVMTRDGGGHGSHRTRGRPGPACSEPIRGGAGFTPQSGAWASARGRPDVSPWRMRPGLPVPRALGPAGQFP